MANKRALVLSGGGAKGAFTAGGVKYLMVELNLNFDLVVGTSTGALTTHLVASHDIANLIHLYENVEQQDILTDRPDLLAFLFSDALNDTKPLERLINKFFGDRRRYEKLVKSAMEMFVTVVNMQTGEIEYGNQHQDPKPKLLKKILASACVPVMMPPVKIGNHQYVDGGFAWGPPAAARKRPPEPRPVAWSMGQGGRRPARSAGARVASFPTTRIPDPRLCTRSFPP